MSTPATGTVSEATPDLMADADAKASAAFDEAINRTVESAPETPAPEGTNPPEVKDAPAAEAVAGTNPPVAEAAVSTTTPDSPAWKKLLSQYGGDAEAAANAWYDTNNRAAQYARERDELAKRLEALEQKQAQPTPGTNPAPAPKPAEVETPQELRYFDNRIRSVEDAARRVVTRRDQFVDLVGKLDAQIGDCLTKLGSGNLSIDAEAVNAELQQAVKNKRDVEFALTQLNEKIAGYDDTWNDLQQFKANALQQYETRQTILSAREAEAREKDQREIGQLSNQWFGAIDKVATDRNVVPEHLEADFRDYVEAKGYSEVDRTGKPIPDFNVYVQNAAKAYMAAVEKHAEKKFAGYSKGKVADAAVTATGDVVATAETAPRKDWTLAQWDEWNEKHPLPGLGG